MNILMLEWDSFAHEYIVEEFKRAGCEVDIFYGHILMKI